MYRRTFTFSFGDLYNALLVCSWSFLNSVLHNYFTFELSMLLNKIAMFFKVCGCMHAHMTCVHICINVWMQAWACGGQRSASDAALPTRWDFFFFCCMCQVGFQGFCCLHLPDFCRSWLRCVLYHIWLAELVFFFPISFQKLKCIWKFLSCLVLLPLLK